MGHGRRLLAAALVVAPVLTVGGTSGPNGLLDLSGLDVGLHASGGTPYVVGELFPCTFAVPLRILGVTALGAHNGLRITGWGVRPTPFARGGEALGEVPGTLAGFGFEHRDLGSSCRGEDDTGTFEQYPVELALQLEHPGPRTAWMTAVDVVYATPDGIGHATSDMEVTLCGQKDEDAPPMCSADRS